MLRGILRGAAAGAAGTTALNALTYADMALRGRPSSSTPEESVEKATGAVGLRVPGTEESRGNRVEGLGALLGMVTGVALGAALGALDEVSKGTLTRLPPGLSAAAVTTGAMVAANVPMA